MLNESMNFDVVNQLEKKKRSEKSIQNLLGNHIIIFVCKGRSRVKTSYMELEVKLF